MNSLAKGAMKEDMLVIGLMSGSSADGIDAALVRIIEDEFGIFLHELAFVTVGYEREFSRHLLQLSQGVAGGSDEFCLVDAYLGQLFVEAALEVCSKAGVSPSSIDLIGSPGHTFSHLPQGKSYFGRQVRSTLQLGEASLLREVFSCPVVSDFKTSDVSAGGQGAPLVSYPEFLLFRDDNRHVGLLNLGGSANLTIIPRKAKAEEIMAFDTGVGNMVLDTLVRKHSKGKKCYDEGGALAALGSVNQELLEWMERVDTFLPLGLPKSTGRLYYSASYVKRLQEKGKALNLRFIDLMATATEYVALSVERGLTRFSPVKLDRIVVSGGGSHNQSILGALKRRLWDIEVLTQEDLGRNSDSKEAVAFALLAHETMRGRPNNLCGATGARHPVVMGKVLM